MAVVEQRRLSNPRDRTIFREVAEQFNVGEQSLRLWARHHDSLRIEETEASGATKVNGHENPESVEAELERLRRRIQKLQAENDVLKKAFVVFSSEWSK